MKAWLLRETKIFVRVVFGIAVLIMTGHLLAWLFHETPDRGILFALAGWVMSESISRK